jgi:uncharacterized membrane protein
MIIISFCFYEIFLACLSYAYERERGKKKGNRLYSFLSILLSVVVFVVLPILRDILRLFLFFFFLLLLFFTSYSLAVASILHQTPR